MSPKRKPHTIKIIAWIPIWIIALFTPAKSFRNNPVIGSKVLNTLGLHVLRLLIARTVTWARWTYLAPLMSESERFEFHRQGYLVLEDFLDEGSIKAIREEVAAHTGEVRQMTQGNTATQRILMDTEALDGKPELNELNGSMSLQARLRYAAANISYPLMYVQRIRNGHQDGGVDPQKTMHADTFHPTMKAWLFLEDVTEEMGPFTYVKGSNRLTWKRLAWEYKRSITARETPDGYSEKGSFRATPEDLREMNLPNPLGLSVKAGTLVIANTNGFHGRGAAQEGQSRLELWAYARPSPFNPLPGIPGSVWSTIKMGALKRFWRHKDKSAAKRNSKASWHVIPANEMTDFKP